MKCPICLVELLVADRQGTELDYCPTCRGVWLDRGELDQLISRAAGAAPPVTSGNRYHDDSDVAYPAQYRSREGSYENQPRRRRRSFLSELFAFR
jgi:Zn-finger nucleic acid-binding protein